ncbi:MAG: GNAT family N-acetyltransferase [Verrucomicrobiales bacterium]|nr:GNAT family N-acetyltransferase [Verrucomicrobiales bacterium]
MDRETRRLLLDQLDEKLRRNCRYIGRDVEKLENVTRVTGPSPSGFDNVIVWSRLNSENADAEIDRHIEWFAAKQHTFTWIVYHHDRPEDLKERLFARGFTLESSDEVVIARSEIIRNDSPPDDIQIRKVTDPQDLADVLQVQDKVWGTGYHDFLSRWLGQMMRDHPEESCIVTAYSDEQPVGSAWSVNWSDRPFAPLFAGCVLPEWRGRGIYRAMVAARAEAAAARGIPWCLVDAGAESLPILLRSGFQTLTSRASLSKGFE